jgi:hypothetical protein
MQLKDDEKAMLDGRYGPARQKAMELLVRYGEALGAERMVDTNNVLTAIKAARPFLREFLDQVGSLDAMFCEINLDSREAFDIPEAKAFACHLIHPIDPDHWEEQGVDRNLYELNARVHAFCTRIGVHMMNTCTPYLVGISSFPPTRAVPTFISPCVSVGTAIL